MENVKSAIRSVKQFAHKKIEEHKAELSTKYEGKEMPTIQLKQKAIDKHKSLFKQELKDEIKKVREKLDDKEKAASELDSLWGDCIRDFEAQVKAGVDQADTNR